MKPYSKKEVEVKGYDSGVTLAVWFPVLPERIPVPPNYAHHADEYRAQVRKGFEDRRRTLQERVTGEKNAEQKT